MLQSLHILFAKVRSCLQYSVFFIRIKNEEEFIRNNEVSISKRRVAILYTTEEVEYFCVCLEIVKTEVVERLIVESTDLYYYVPLTFFQWNKFSQLKICATI